MENAKEISAKTLSKNKIKKISEKQILVSDESKNSNFFDNNGISNKPSSRGWYDIASLNLRYIDSKTFNKFCPSNEKKNIYSKFLQLQDVCHSVLGNLKVVKKILKKYYLSL